MKPWKLKLHLIAEQVFQYSLITYLILLLVETLQEGFVSFFFNLNILLFIVLIGGVIMVLTHSEVLDEEAKPKKITGGDVQNALVFAILGGFFVWYKTMDLGDLAIVIAVLTGIIIILLSLLILTEKSK